MPDTETMTRGAFTARIMRDGTQVFADIYDDKSGDRVESWTGTHMKSVRLWALRHLADLATK